MERLEGGGGVLEAFWTGVARRLLEAFWTGVARKMSQGEKRRYSTCRLVCWASNAGDDQGIQ